MLRNFHDADYLKIRFLKILECLQEFLLIIQNSFIKFFIIIKTKVSNFTPQLDHRIKPRKESKTSY